MREEEDDDGVPARCSVKRGIGGSLGVALALYQSEGLRLPEM